MALKFSREFCAEVCACNCGEGRKVSNSLENFITVLMLKSAESLYEFWCIGASMGAMRALKRWLFMLKCSKVCIHYVGLCRFCVVRF